MVIWLEYAAFLSFIHHFSNIFVEFVMFQSISEIQPRRVSWGDNINWRRYRGEEIEAQLPWENDTVSSFDDRQGLKTVSSCNHLSGDSTRGRPAFGDSTFKF